MLKMWLMFPPTDRKAADPSQAGDQTDGKLKDKDRWVHCRCNRQSCWLVLRLESPRRLLHSTSSSLFSISGLDVASRQLESQRGPWSCWLSAAESGTQAYAPRLIHCHCFFRHHLCRTPTGIDLALSCSPPHTSHSPPLRPANQCAQRCWWEKLKWNQRMSQWK